jgi:hypothetical protein
MVDRYPLTLKRRQIGPSQMSFSVMIVVWEPIVREPDGILFRIAKKVIRSLEKRAQLTRIG